ncbi:MAG: glutathione S-transferase N-terminal domain-containing protein [Sphingobium sp.]
MIDLHFWPTPNGWKITIALEELGLPYRLHPVDIGNGDQFDPAFLRLSPNGRIPAIVDHAPVDGGEPVSSFESGAILIYLAEKAGSLLPSCLRERQKVLEWLMWQMSGLGPMLGQHGHFLLYAPERVDYGINRYGRETRRLYRVLDDALSRSDLFLTGEYSIADIACFPWIMTHKAQGLSLDDYPAVRRWYAALRERPALQRGLAVGKGWASAATRETAATRLFGNDGIGAKQ